MKLNKKAKVLLALAGMTFMASAANAAVTSGGNTPNTDLTTTNGDLILSVAGSQTGTGNPVDLEFDLGLASAFTGSVNLSSTVLAADLNSVFGSAWYTSGALTWAVVGTTKPVTIGTKSDTVYATSAASTPGTSGAFGAFTITGLAASAGTPIKGMDNFLSQAGTAAQGDNVSAAMVLQSVSSSYTSAEGSNTNSFGLGQSVDGQLGGSSGAQVLDLYQIVGGGADTLLGTFTIASTGPTNATVTFTAVPEPSTYAMLGLGAFGLYFLARRKRQFNFAN
ncbi:MAG: PEP-CTERM sorting domain-containing protein [Chthoniobacteraceae bacterium]